MKKRFKKITKRKGFIKYFQKVMALDKCDDINYLLIPILNIIVAIILTICFPIILLIYITKGEETYYEEINLLD